MNNEKSFCCYCKCNKPTKTSCSVANQEKNTFTRTDRKPDKQRAVYQIAVNNPLRKTTKVVSPSRYFHKNHARTISYMITFIQQLRLPARALPIGQHSNTIAIPVRCHATVHRGGQDLFHYHGPKPQPYDKRLVSSLCHSWGKNTIFF